MAFVAALIYEGEMTIAATGPTREAAEARLRAAHLHETAQWYGGDVEAAAEAIQQDEDRGNIVFSVCALADEYADWRQEWE